MRCCRVQHVQDLPAVFSHTRDLRVQPADPNPLAVSSIPRGRLEPTDKEFSPRWGNDSAMEEVAHDPVSRRPVVCVAGVVMGAKVAPRGRGVPTLEAETHLFMPPSLLVSGPAARDDPGARERCGFVSTRPSRARPS